MEESCKILYINHSSAIQLALLDLRQFETISGLSGKRELEKNGALHIIQTVLKSPAIQLHYQSNGKPYLLNGPKISISHSSDWVGVLFSEGGEEIGLDIEKIRDKVLSIKHKFLSAIELQELGSAGVEKYTLYWAVKEAVYKASGIEGLLFAEEIAIEPFALKTNSGMIKAMVERKDVEKNFTLRYILQADHVIVFTVDDQE